MKTNDYKLYFIFKGMLIIKRAILTSLILTNLLFIRYADAQCGYALEFEDSDTSYVYPGTDWVWAPTIEDVSNDFTMEFWVRPTKSIKTGMVETLSNFNAPGTGENGQNYAIRSDWYHPPEPLDWNIWDPNGIYNIGGPAGAGVSVGTNGIAVIEHSAWYMPATLVYYTPISSSAWTHIAVVYTNKTPSLYMNGSWVRTGLTSLKDSIHPSSFLGDSYKDGPFDGAIDEVKIWDVSLSAGTISTWYDQSVTSNHPDYEHLHTYLRFNEGSGSITSDASGNGHHGTLVNSPTWISGWLPEGATNPVVDAGADISTFFGAGAVEIASRSATVSGGTPPYSFTWTLDRPLLCDQVTGGGDEWFYGGTYCTNFWCPEGASPSEPALCSGSDSITALLLDTATVCVTVTDANGCTGSDCFVINASDVRCFAGNGNQKVKMCHHTNSNGTPWVEMCVDFEAVDAHLAHGDYIGACYDTKSMDMEPAEETDMHYKLFPNPATDEVTIQFESENESSYTIELDDMMGKKLAEYQGKAIRGENTVELVLKGIERGIYLAKLVLDGKQEVKKMVVE